MNNNTSEIEILREMTIHALDITERIVNHVKDEDIEKVMLKLDDRHRVINIIDRITQSLSLDAILEKFPDYLRIITRIQTLDEAITTDLVSLKNSVHLEIAKTFKTKENFKGYNLNNIK